MPAESRPLARQLLRVAFGTPDVPDRDLLARFVQSRDEEAFAEIVRRHGPMVLAVCRRVTGRPHDADDAFQAAFLVLARRAGHVTRPELLANWLYGVAYRTALEARAARRRTEDRIVPAAPEPAAPEPNDDTAELRKVIDEELARLPDKYRSAVVLCELEGLSRATAAAQLGIPEGTLSSRLAHARKVLAERLARRGVTAGSAAAAAAFGRDAMATVVTHSLMHTVVYAAARYVPGAGFPPGVSPAVSSLTDGVLKTMLATRLKHLFAAVLLTGGVIGLGAALAQQPTRTANPTNPFDPLVAAADPGAALPLPAQPARPQEPKKVAAKGIEDDDVPYGTFPAQAVVRLEEDKLVVRQRGHFVEAVQATTTGDARSGGQVVTTYVRKSSVQATTHDSADVAVFDMKGNRLAAKDWKAQLKSDVHALVANDGKLPNPRELTLFKADTLLIVLPAAPQMAPAFAPAASGTTIYANPVAPAARPAQPGLPAPAPRATPALPGLPAPRPGGAGSVPAAPTELAAPKQAPDAFPTVNGTVVEVNGDAVAISIGRDAGLKVGTKLGMIRDRGRLLGELTVTKVDAKTAIGTFTAFRAGVPLNKLDADELPQRGDTAYFAPNPIQ